MLSQQEMSDRFEIQALLVDYIDAIDAKNFDALDDVFSKDAIIDYSAVGGAVGNLSEIKTYLTKALEKFPSSQHMLGLPQLKIDDDTATARTICFNPMVIERDGAPHVFFVGIWYVDKLVRSEKGWRITHRTEEFSYFHNFPKDFQPAEA